MEREEGSVLPCAGKAREMGWGALPSNLPLSLILHPVLSQNQDSRVMWLKSTTNENRLQPPS